MAEKIPKEFRKFRIPGLHKDIRPSDEFEGAAWVLIGLAVVAVTINSPLLATGMIGQAAVLGAIAHYKRTHVEYEFAKTSGQLVSATPEQKR